MNQQTALEKQENVAADKALAVEKGYKPSRPQPMSLAEIQQWGDVFHKSGMFPDVKSAAAAMVQIKAGEELGFGPFASMSGIDIIKGRVSVGSGLQASLIKDSSQYRYQVQRLDADGCVLEFFERYDGKWHSLGESEFTRQDAATAGLVGNDNYKKWGRNMFFARALTNGMRWYTPNLLRSCGGQSEDYETYDVDETVTETQENTIDGEIVTDTTPDGTVVDTATGEVVAEPQTPPAPEQEPVQQTLVSTDSTAAPAPAPPPAAQNGKVKTACNLANKLQEEHGVEFEALAMQFLPEGVAKFEDLTENDAAGIIPGLAELLTNKVQNG